MALPRRTHQLALASDGHLRPMEPSAADVSRQLRINRILVYTTIFGLSLEVPYRRYVMSRPVSVLCAYYRLLSMTLLMLKLIVILGFQECEFAWLRAHYLRDWTIYYPTSRRLGLVRTYIGMLLFHCVIKVSVFLGHRRKPFDASLIDYLCQPPPPPPPPPLTPPTQLAPDKSLSQRQLTVGRHRRLEVTTDTRYLRDRAHWFATSARITRANYLCLVLILPVCVFILLSANVRLGFIYHVAGACDLESGWLRWQGLVELDYALVECALVICSIFSYCAIIRADLSVQMDRVERRLSSLVVETQRRPEWTSGAAQLDLGLANQPPHKRPNLTSRPIGRADFRPDASLGGERLVLSSRLDAPDFYEQLLRPRLSLRRPSANLRPGRPSRPRFHPAPLIGVAHNDDDWPCERVGGVGTANTALQFGDGPMRRRFVPPGHSNYPHHRQPLAPAALGHAQGASSDHAHLDDRKPGPVFETSAGGECDGYAHKVDEHETYERLMEAQDEVVLLLRCLETHKAPINFIGNAFLLWLLTSLSFVPLMVKTPNNERAGLLIYSMCTSMSICTSFMFTAMGASIHQRTVQLARTIFKLSAAFHSRAVAVRWNKIAMIWFCPNRCAFKVAGVFNLTSVNILKCVSFVVSSLTLVLNYIEVD